MVYKNLYVIYVSPLHEELWIMYPVYCCACSSDAALDFVSKYAVDKLGYSENSFTLSDPLLLTDFIF